MTGSDWRQYEELYMNAQSLSILNEVNKEKGFPLFFVACNKLGLSFWPVWIGIKFVCYYIMIKMLLRYTTKYSFLWGILIFYAYFSLFYFIDNPMRNLMAATVYLFAYDSLISRKRNLYIIIVLLGSLLHASILFFLPVYFIYNEKRFLKNKTLIISLVYFYVVMVVFWYSNIREVVEQFLITVEGEDFRGQRYLQQEGSLISVGFITMCSFFSLILYNRDVIKECSKNPNFLLLFSYIYIITYIMGFFIPILSRLSMFCFIPFISAFCIAMQGFKGVLRRILNIAVIVFMFATLTKNITRDYRYVPYSSYIEYIGIEKPSYMERVYYNMVHTPYKDYE